MKKAITAAALILLLLAAALLISFVPTLNLETADMKRLEGQWITVYYETEEEAALDVFQLADAVTADIARTLGFTEKQNVAVYIYDSQSTMQTKKYGWLAPLLGLDWYIGDNIGTSVILTSPANPGPMHDYDNNKYASLHEIVHAYVSVMNPDIDLWLTEGVALYLTNGAPFRREFLEQWEIPSYELTRSRNPITFSNGMGYNFAHTYIEYLHAAYGWDAVLELLRTQDYVRCFGKTQKDIYGEWTAYLQNYPQ